MLTKDQLPSLRESIDNFYDITFFVPCRNEEFAIIRTLEKIKRVSLDRHLNFEIIVYNDASTDRTQELVLQFQKENPNVSLRLINRLKRHGLGSNYIDGAYQGFGKHYMMVCGDDSETEISMHQILEKMGQADLIIPYFAHLDQRIFLRRNLSKIFTTLVNFISGRKLHYYNGTVLHLRKNVVRHSPTSSGFAYQAELIGILLDYGMTTCEINISNNDREKGVSRAFTILNFLSVTHSLIQIFFRRIRRNIWPVT